MNKLVTVIISTYNMARFLEESIESVLKQSYSNIELIIVDDDSKDKTQEILIKYKNNKKIKIIKQEHLGKLLAIKRALEIARGELITIHDADDTLPRESIKKRAEFLLKNPGVLAVYGDASCMDIKGKAYKIRKSKQINAEKDLLGAFRSPIVGTTLMFRNQVLTDIKKLKNAFDGADDLYLKIRLYQNGKLVYLPFIFLNYRKYPRKNQIFRRFVILYNVLKVTWTYSREGNRFIYIFKELFFHIYKILRSLFS